MIEDTWRRGKGMRTSQGNEVGKMMMILVMMMGCIASVLCIESAANDYTLYAKLDGQHRDIIGK